MARSRKDAWLRDEIILALDLYRQEGRNPPAEAIAEVSKQLRAIPIEPQLSDDPLFRNPSGVRLKVANFVALDPTTGTKGMTRGSKLDAIVFDEFWSQSSLLSSTAAAIRANIENLDPTEAAVEDSDIEEALEGRILTRTHRIRERSKRLVAKKKREALQRDRRLACEVCDFDFSATYGARGDGYIECHHIVPLHDLRPGTRTKVDDLALLCSNCHRMIHVRSPWLSLAQLRRCVQGNAQVARKAIGR
jgi:5-methylcytosine-specific restriction enzyme A